MQIVTARPSLGLGSIKPLVRTNLKIRSLAAPLSTIYTPQSTPRTVHFTPHTLH